MTEAKLEFHPRYAPICIGIVGHLDVHREDEGQAAKAMATLFDAIVAQFPSTPVRMLSPLAVGADRIAARAFIRAKEDLAARHPDRARRWELVVPMPLPRDLFVADFPDAIDEFEHLLAQASHAFSLPARPGSRIEELSRHGVARDLQYQDASRYVATHCDILVAIWDGLDPKKIGGTCDTIRLRLDAHVASERMHFSPLAEASRPVLHVRVRRVRVGDAPAAEPHLLGAVSKSVPDVVRQAIDLRRIDQFNAMVDRLPRPAFEKAIDWSMPAKLREDVLASDLGPSRRDCRRDCLELFATADAIATRLGPRWEKLTKAVYALGIASVSILPFAVEGFGLPWSAIAYFLGLAIAATIVLWMKRASVADDHLESRALAEMLRIQLAWLFSGMQDPDNERNPCVEDTVELQKPVTVILLGQQQREMGWIAPVLTNLVIVRWPKHDRIPEQLAMKVVLEWIQVQMEYCRDKARKAKRLVHLVERITLPLVVLGLGFAMGAALLAFMGVGHTTLRHVCVALSAALPVAAIVMENYVDRLGGGDHARMYERLAEIYNSAGSLLSKRDLPAETRERVITETGREALAEASMWLFLRRIRPVKVAI